MAGLVCLFAWAASPDAAEIMARMAANMESAMDARRQYVYQQSVRARLLKTNGDRAREERREYTATPGPERTEKKLESLAGEYWKSKKEVIRYDQPGFKKDGLDLDGEIMEDLIEDLVNSKKSRDGIPHAMFPLRSPDLSRYKFAYVAAAEVQGRAAHRIAFEPAVTNSRCLNLGDEDEGECATSWKGEAWVDAEELQPVRLFTDSTFKMPRAVKMFLGTNLQQVGFSVTYTRVAPGVWFPASYGSEFRFDLLFRYNRVITLAMESKEFRKTGAESTVKFDVPAL